MSEADMAGDAEILDPEIRRFVEYWQAKRLGLRYPARAALDPLDFRYVLGDVVLIETHRPSVGSGDAWDFRYRLIGSNVVARDGYDLTNKSLDDLPEPEYRARIRTTWTAVCESGQPAHYVRDLVLDDRRRCYEVVVMPLASNGQDIDMLISVQREVRPAIAERRHR
jgi:hypothetical protein